MADDDKSGLSGSLAKSFDQYEYVAVMTPGATLLFGLLLILPTQPNLLTRPDVGLGALGIFLVAAYVIGHIIRALGDGLEECFWSFFGGWPTDWVLQDKRIFWICKAKRHLLDADQRQNLQNKLKTMDASAKELATYETDHAAWMLMLRRMYAAAAKAGGSARIDAFNRTYGLMIGVTVALLVLTAVQAFMLLWSGGSRHQELYCALTFIAAMLTLNRAYRFGVHYGRELFAQFLQTPATAFAA